MSILIGCSVHGGAFGQGVEYSAAFPLGIAQGRGFSCRGTGFARLERNDGSDCRASR
jgi:hypothetical protein